MKKNLGVFPEKEGMIWEEQQRNITKNVRRAWQDIEDRRDLVFKTTNTE
jgi:hypothetical protein